MPGRLKEELKEQDSRTLDNVVVVTSTKDEKKDEKKEANFTVLPSADSVKAKPVFNISTGAGATGVTGAKRDIKRGRLAVRKYKGFEKVINDYSTKLSKNYKLFLIDIVDIDDIDVVELIREKIKYRISSVMLKALNEEPLFLQKYSGFESELFLILILFAISYNFEVGSDEINYIKRYVLVTETLEHSEKAIILDILKTPALNQENAAKILKTILNMPGRRLWRDYLDPIFYAVKKDKLSVQRFHQQLLVEKQDDKNDKLDDKLDDKLEDSKVKETVEDQEKTEENQEESRVIKDVESDEEEVRSKHDVQQQDVGSIVYNPEYHTRHHALRTVTQDVPKEKLIHDVDFAGEGGDGFINPDSIIIRTEDDAVATAIYLSEIRARREELKKVAMVDDMEEAQRASLQQYQKEQAKQVKELEFHQMLEEQIERAERLKKIGVSEDYLQYLEQEQLRNDLTEMSTHDADQLEDQVVEGSVVEDGNINNSVDLENVDSSSNLNNLNINSSNIMLEESDLYSLPFHDRASNVNDDDQISVSSSAQNLVKYLVIDNIRYLENDREHENIRPSQNPSSIQSQSSIQSHDTVVNDPNRLNVKKDTTGKMGRDMVYKLDTTDEVIVENDSPETDSDNAFETNVNSEDTEDYLLQQYLKQQNTMQSQRSSHNIQNILERIKNIMKIENFTSEAVESIQCVCGLSVVDHDNIPIYRYNTLTEEDKVALEASGETYIVTPDDKYFTYVLQPLCPYHQYQHDHQHRQHHQHQHHDHQHHQHYLRSRTRDWLSGAHN